MDEALSFGQPILEPARFGASPISPALGGINNEGIAGGGSQAQGFAALGYYLRPGRGACYTAHRETEERAPW
jgi:hypothetical protein